MASGAILGKCPVCSEWVWEDDWEMDEEGTMFHAECMGKPIPADDPEQKLIIEMIRFLIAKGYEVTKREEQ